MKSRRQNSRLFFVDFNITYADVLEGINNELSEKWRKLWKIFIICSGITFGSLVLVLLAPGLAALAALGGLIGMLVSGVLEWVYLYRTAKFFREYPMDQQKSHPFGWLF